MGSRDGQAVGPGSRISPMSDCGCWSGLERMVGWDLAPLCSRLGQGFKHVFVNGAPGDPGPFVRQESSLQSPAGL